MNKNKEKIISDELKLDEETKKVLEDVLAGRNLSKAYTNVKDLMKDLDKE